MPNLLSIAKKLNREKNLGLSRSEVEASAAAMERRCEGWLLEDPEAYVLQYWDETGECAVSNVIRTQNKANAARRTAA
jgi:hypothetical protein